MANTSYEMPRTDKTTETKNKQQQQQKNKGQCFSGAGRPEYCLIWVQVSFWSNDNFFQLKWWLMYNSMNIAKILKCAKLNINYTC